jgi:hypothetical protein
LEWIIMCDYSLEAYRSRPARAGEEYVSHRFWSGSVGFVAPGDMQTAVCMACDVRLRIENVPAAIQSLAGVGSTAMATFAHVEAGPYRDGVRFDNGKAVSLQQLGPGVRVWVEDALVRPVGVSEAKPRVAHEREFATSD